jgi:hypothetical protein
MGTWEESYVICKYDKEQTGNNRFSFFNCIILHMLAIVIYKDSQPLIVSHASVKIST